MENKIVPRSNHLGWKHYGLHLTLALKGSAIGLQCRCCDARLSGMSEVYLGVAVKVFLAPGPLPSFSPLSR